MNQDFLICNMYERFLQYIHTKKLSQRKLSELSCVSASTVSRFCSGLSIVSDKLLKLLQVCDDLSLEWLFYGSGEMLRRGEGSTYNVGTFAGADAVSKDSVVVGDSKGACVQQGSSFADLQKLLLEKDRVISERDRTISELHRLLASK